MTSREWRERLCQERIGNRPPPPPEEEAKAILRAADAIRDGVRATELAERFPVRIREAARALVKG